MSRAVTRNLTIALESQVARWVSRAAAEQDLSVSRFLGRLLKERMLADHGYAAAMRDALGEKPLSSRWSGRYPTRDEIHERR